VKGIEPHLATVTRFFLAALLLVESALVVAGCTPATVPVRPTETAVAVGQIEPVTLRVEVKPPGATVLVDGQPRGTTPLTLTLSPGQHTVRVEKSGYQALEETLTWSAAERVTVDGSLVDVSPPTVAIQFFPKQPLAGQHVVVYVTAYDNLTVARLELWIDGQRVLEEVGATATYHWDLPADEPGQHVLVSQAHDVAGNVTTLEQSLTVAAAPPAATTTPTSPPTATPWPTWTSTPVVSASSTLWTSPIESPTPESTPTATLRPVPTANVYYETTLSILTYPYADYLQQETDSRYGVPLWRLDRAAYEAIQPTPTLQTYRALVIENEYLQLTFLPELGGRLYRCVYKPTGQNIFYQNPVIEPSRWGPLTPTEHNWWLAAGGIEWALPVNEHGYEFGVPWNYSVQVTPDSVTVTLWDSDAGDRLRFEVKVTLPSQQAAFIVQPRLTNPLKEDVRVQLWLNAALTLGSHTIAPETEFVLPAGPVVVHSTGDATLAAAKEVMSWPLHGGRDLSRYANWRQWLGVFVEQPAQNFAGAYNHATGLGVARVFPSQVAPGVKLFAFGPEFGDRDHYTDDGSQYFELWGGPNRTFWPEDDVLLPAGGEIAWEETWLPFADVGGLTFANEAAVLYLERREGRVDVGLSVSKPIQGQVRLLAGEGESAQSIWQQAVNLLPGGPLRQQVQLPADLAADAKIGLQLTDQAGNVLLDYRLQD
jgi:hypothetical protein